MSNYFEYKLLCGYSFKKIKKKYELFALQEALMQFIYAVDDMKK